MSVADRLRELGVPLGAPAGVLALYRPALVWGDAVVVSGQLPMRDGALIHRGRVGDDVGLEEAREAARQCALNGLAAAAAALGSDEALEDLRVLRTAGYVAATPAFTQQPEVINGASELLREALGEEHGVGARAAVGVASLPRGACVEVEFLFATRSG